MENVIKRVSHIRYEDKAPVNIALYNRVKVLNEFRKTSGRCLIRFYSDFKNVEDIDWNFFFDEIRAKKECLKVHTIVGSGCCTYPLNGTCDREEMDIFLKRCSDWTDTQAVTKKGQKFIDKLLEEFERIACSARSFLKNRVEHDIATGVTHDFGSGG